MAFGYDRVLNMINSGIVSEKEIFPFLVSYSEFSGEYIIARLANNSYQLFKDGEPFGKTYKNMKPVVDKNLTGSDRCHAILVSRDDGMKSYICPFDKEQILLDNQVQSIILSSFLYYASIQLKNLTYAVEYGDKLIPLQIEYPSKEKIYSRNQSYICSPIGSEIELSYYDENICHYLNQRFKTLIEDYKKKVLDDRRLGEKSKQKLINEVLPEWGKVTNNDLNVIYKLISDGKLKDILSEKTDDENSSPRVKDPLIAQHLNNAEIRIIEERIDEKQRNQIEGLISENHKSNGGTLESNCILPNTYKVLIEIDGEIIGYAGVLLNRTSNELYVSQIAIKKDYQGYGIGSKMYEYIKKNSKPYSILSADVRSSNTYSKKLHLKQGFVDIHQKGIKDISMLIWKDNSSNYNSRYEFDLEKLKDRNPMKIGVATKLFDENFIAKEA